MESFIITQLDRISVKGVINRRRRTVSYSGNCLGAIDGKVDEGTGIEFPGHSRYLFHFQGKPLAFSPLYVSTSGTVLRNRIDLGYSFTKLFNYEEEGLEFVDNLLIVHDSSFKPVRLSVFYPRLKAKRYRDFPAYVITDGLNRSRRESYFNECQFDFEESIKLDLVAGEVMELDGIFKLKPRTGKATRKSGTYHLRGDQEFVLQGHVHATVGSTSIYLDSDYSKDSPLRISPSLIKLSAQGELVT